jgi:hypothetical protein
MWSKVLHEFNYFLEISVLAENLPMHSHPNSRSGQISLGRSGQGPAGSGQVGPARDRSGRAGPDPVEK